MRVRAAASIAEAIAILNRLSDDDFAEVMDSIVERTDANIPFVIGKTAARFDGKQVDAMVDVLWSTAGGELLRDHYIKKAVDDGELVDPREVDDGADEIEGLTTKLLAAEDWAETIADDLYNAIVEGRRDDAIASCLSGSHPQLQHLGARDA